MTANRDGTAVVYCQGAFGTTNGKTAHGLVRKTRRYHVGAVVDSRCAGRDAGEVLDGRPNDIPIHGDVEAAIQALSSNGTPATHLVIGLAPDGGRLPPTARADVLTAILAGLNVDSGLHDFLSEDAEFAAAAAKHGVTLRDVRKPPHKDELHFFSGKIEQVTSLKVALLGTDSAVGKRTTSWILVDALNAGGHRAELVGTGQTAWMQGARFGLILDSLICDFVAGEIEHAVWSAWNDENPEVIIIEGQGSLMNPAYPGGLEIIAAGRPDVIIMQHAPTRKEYDGFPGYAMHSLERQIEATEMLSDKPVIAVTINHEGLERSEVSAVCAEIERSIGQPVRDVLLDGGDDIVAALLQHAPTAAAR